MAGIRDAIAAREIVHEWSELFARLGVARLKSGLPAFDPSDEEMRRFFGSMPHTQVAISMKMRYHSNPRHNWTPNDISDIDAMSVAYAYCEAVFPDKAVRAALLNSRELRGIGTFVPRRPQDLADWLDALPIANTPDLLVPHPFDPNQLRDAGARSTVGISPSVIPRSGAGRAFAFNCQA